MNHLSIRRYRNKSAVAGFSLVEVLLAVSLFALFSLGFAGAYFYGQESSVLAGERARAVLFAEEGLEAVRNIRDDDFANLDDGTYGLEINGGEWRLFSGTDTLDIFTREISISRVDNDRKRVDSTVTWQQNAQREGEVTLSTYFSDWQAPLDCTGPPAQRPAGCKKGGGGG